MDSFGIENFGFSPNLWSTAPLALLLYHYGQAQRAGARLARCAARSPATCTPTCSYFVRRFSQYSRGRGYRDWRTRGDPTLINSLWRSRQPLGIRKQLGKGLTHFAEITWLNLVMIRPVEFFQHICLDKWSRSRSRFGVQPNLSGANRSSAADHAKTLRNHDKYLCSNRNNINGVFVPINNYWCIIIFILWYVIF